MRGLLLLILAGAAAATVWVAARGARRTGTDYGPADGVAAESRGDKSFRPPQLRELDALLASWQRAPRDAARRVVDKYGVPDEAEARRLVWNDSGPWKRVVARRDAATGLVEFVAPYRVPLDRYELLDKLPGSVSAERGQEELSARAPSEALALLALNLADEALSGKRPLAETRPFYESQAALIEQGRAPPYAQRLHFLEPAKPEAKR